MAEQERQRPRRSHRARLVATVAGLAIWLSAMTPAGGVEVSRPITTVAGTGEAGFAGDGGRAVEASFREPRTAVLDTAGNVFLTDTYNHRIRRIDRSSVITTVAGSGEGGFGGDGGPATSARMKWPHSVAVDGAGNLFVADSANSRIRRVDTQGIITTVAGNGLEGFGGDGVAATATGLNRPKGVAIGPDGMLYIADSLNNRVRRVDAQGIITTIAGTGQAGAGGDGGLATQAQLDRPRTLAFDMAGNLYVAEDEGNRVRRIDARGLISTVAGTGSPGFGGDGGPATNARLDNPRGLVVLDREAIVDGDGATTALLVVDTMNHRLRRIAPRN